MTQTKKRFRFAALAGLSVLVLTVNSGCTSRGMTVTSIPPGAEVSINRRVVGTTPVRVNYTHYGTYRVELRRERYETLVKDEKVRPPAYGYDPISFVADNMLPARINDEVYLHYVMNPVDEKYDRGSLLERAALARGGKVTHPRTQEALEIALAPLSAKAAETDVASVELGREEGPSPAPKLDLPKELRSPEGVKEKPPEGPRISPELGLAGPETKEKDPKAAKPAEKRPKRMLRTPKGEVLIYEEESVEDPDKKK